MPTYKIKWEIDIDADSPEAAVKTVDKWLSEPNDGWIFEVILPDGSMRHIDTAELGSKDED